MEGVVALLIPIIAVGGFFAWMIALSPVGKAFAERLRGGTGLSTPGAGGDAVLQELEQLRHEVAELFQLLERSEEHTSELQSRLHLVCRLLLEKKKKNIRT